MDIARVLLEQLDREATPTRRLLARVPDGKPDWKPHPKSMPLGYLATLVATMPGWVAMIVERDHLDLGGGGGAPPDTAQARLELFDASIASARRALSTSTEEHLLQPWQLRVSGKVVDEKPRHAMIADTIAHLAHHRGQLSVYLRLNEVPLPSIYGPTADETWQPGE
jgi:hypothetical protein